MVFVYLSIPWGTGRPSAGKRGPDDMDVLGVTAANLADLVTNVGLPVALVIVFVWWTLKREKALTARLDHVQDEMNQLQREVISKNTETISRNTAVVQEASATFKSHADTLVMLVSKIGSLKCVDQPWDGVERRRQSAPGD